ncbi:MAG: hypothetical protein HYX41_05425 [Bdellovibrio sp.]|nr:hypothetical protein [Bdellovibrio sp.]
MNHCVVNGVRIEIPFSESAPLKEVISYVQEKWVPDHTYISSLRVNGSEISEKQERALAQTPYSEFTSIEVFTAHPREIAENTLQNLIEFSDLLEKFCARIGTNSKSSKFYADFSKLMDGIGTLTEGISVVKKIFNITPNSVPHLDGLENNLLSILQELLKLQEAKKTAELGTLIREGLRENIQNWRDVALPALVRSRDC